MKRTDFQFELPEELIAQFPPEKRGDSRLLSLNSSNGTVDDKHFSDLPDMLDEGDLLVFNDTRVMKARLHGVKETGGQVEILVERLLDDSYALAHVRASKSPKPGTRLLIDDGIIEVRGREGDLFELTCTHPGFASLMENKGHVPLPPYIERDDEVEDLERYQTVYGEKVGAVAAPTAGLHFTHELLERLDAKGIHSARVTLHVGAGTFQPVRVDNLSDHVMHSEWLEVAELTCEQVRACKEEGRRVVAVGTTSVRALESAATSGQLKPYVGDTELFITPGYQFNVIDALVTNFHLSESTLLMLVSALGGVDNIRHAYQHAIDQRYRFFSYGDAMLISP
ncbi:tRNA preQ1(34) S-adenosylmethionine ribosyltransferase-isomerase QueA [Solemya velum gill symbiont]|uniref:tRNA preQ1(34) S-adenosylmethionine ribosyltransferase-isomerase QueA n=1 Tax=Solemya velum gill symbiont TaxID=2340 RepID=UPI000998511D|nr:tRNA preQ1(34) S-adenosylmethionine ribosyltransferase-isomerase QueA [Solemya velum gill symbiont]OOY37278.1 tRNA preQ1(34) S-adenosylmethionine ribosyltransferase-isomerase QueA [Solemya velum gill symbiont]OOY40509.1 tRNA preQ1(34) S-adenosylmethionine ribosyltransferase-isomerase QueA [Solemya velum gill symbiont]OOY45775.1 tRNA preQ1(34) S-adenosylmethionine ribosyltransferase-isomerase QueA [Solemya velum gill symbiont]OOY47597.1 tRNA preQ1(34) S-adenosylmethionine ribosyltransferase-i